MRKIAQVSELYRMSQASDFDGRHQGFVNVLAQHLAALGAILFDRR
jgi:hypothetical protein